MRKCLPSHKEEIGTRRALVLGKLLGVGHRKSQTVVQSIEADFRDCSGYVSNLMCMESERS